MASNGELACTFALLILNDENIPVTAEKISKLLGSAKVSTESYWPSLFAKLAEKRSIEDLLLTIPCGGSDNVTASAGAPNSGAASEEDKKKEDAKEEVIEEEEEDVDLFDLFA